MSERFVPEKLQVAWKLLARWIEEDRAPAVGAVVGGSAWMSEAKVLGRQMAASDSPPVRDDAIFLIASPTKPVMALAVMRLVEQGLVALSDPISRFVPQFAAEGKGNVTILNCLTHTSGLPDMLPDNTQLRAREAPLADFLASTCAVKPTFAAGHGVLYQSMGFLMLSEVVHQVTGRTLPQVLRDEVFQPLSMHDTALGMPPDWEQGPPGAARVERIAEVRLSAMPDGHTVVWNRPYWRRLGAPWGGLLSTPADLARLCQHILGIHQGRDGVISKAGLAAMTANQLAMLPDVPEINRRCHPWGLGWRLNWPGSDDTFGDLLSPSAYGHWGATGTMVWIDPARDSFAVLLTTEPLSSHRFPHAAFSNAACAALA